MRKLFACLLAASMVVGLFACGKTGDTAQDTGTANSTLTDTSDAGDEVQQAERTDGERAVVKLWSSRVPEQGKPDYMADFKQQFEAENPDIEIELSVIAWADLRTTITPALKSGEGPDVFQYTPGPGYVGVMAEAGMLMEMDDAVEQQGWDTFLPDWYREQMLTNGKLYGVSNGLTLLGVYYNKDIFADLSLEVPTTYDDFLEICEIIKADGSVAPLVLDMKDQWPAFHYSTLFYTSFVGAEKLLEAEQTMSGWDGPEFVVAHQAMVDLIDAGYCFGDPNGIASADATTEFLAGQAAMRMSGSWLVEDYYEKIGDNCGFFPLPPAEGVEAGVSGGTGDIFCISATTEYPEESLRVTDALLRYIPFWASGFSPVSEVNPDEIGNPLDIEVYETIRSASSIGIIVDTCMPQGYNETMQVEYQKLWAGKASPQEVADALQAALE